MQPVVSARLGQHFELPEKWAEWSLVLPGLVFGSPARCLAEEVDEWSLVLADLFSGAPVLTDRVVSLGDRLSHA